MIRTAWILATGRTGLARPRNLILRGQHLFRAGYGYRTRRLKSRWRLQPVLNGIRHEINSTSGEAQPYLQPATVSRAHEHWFPELLRSGIATCRTPYVHSVGTPAFAHDCRAT